MTSNEEDMVRFLPEEILQHIISFLDMKQVVQLSIVSKKWRYLWLSVRNLNFNHTMWSTTSKRRRFGGVIHQKPSFINFVDQVLLRLHRKTDVAKFFISCGSYCDVNQIDEWIAAVAKCNARDVHIEIARLEWHTFPPCLFTSELERFTFKASTMRFYSAQLPNTMCSAAHLKTLKLVSAKLPDGDSNREVMLSCPLLENLIMIDCDHGWINILNICLPQLKNFVLENYEWTTNLSFKIKICTPSLKAFDCKGYMYKDYCFENLSTLVSANIGLRAESKEQVQSLLEILKALRHAELTLTIRNWRFQTLSEFRDVLEWLPNPLQNIRQLKLIIWWCDGSSFRAITNLLKAFPFIESIVLVMDEVPRDADLNMPMAFECFFYQLKRIEFRNPKGYENVLKLLEVVLKKAIVLEKITITTRKVFSMEKKEIAEFTKKLQSLSETSSVAMSVLRRSDSPSY